MKVIKETTKSKDRVVTLRISQETMKKVDGIAKKYEVSRQKLIEAILEQVIADEKFVLKVKG